ncbi:EamA family transporter [Tepidibacter mesophilus]|uniref:EamA family transporter n=1 Tax=Tepidibacter mesophilus TaxID=655607 RepID=UPI000C07B53E|nr:EamA family transporter [Tepidibacter mesophilus]
MYYFSIMLVILTSVMYHICCKYINESINPAVSMVGTYSIALILSILSIFIFKNKDIILEFKKLNWASYILGIAIFGIEIGFLLAYRNGWSINVVPLFVNIITSIILIVIGICFFKTRLSMINVLGICISVLGLILMNKK